MQDVPRDMETIGEVVMRGDNIMDGYYKEPQATAAVMSDGWLHTGDMAVWDEENYIHIVDRKKDIIISGGENISSIEVERAIFAHPAVLECAVVSAPDPQWGEVPAAYVVLQAGQCLTEQELCEFLQSRIAKFKMPRQFQFTDDPLPKTGTGKILKRELRETFWKEVASGNGWQRTTPVAGSLALSALVAAIPIFTLLVLLGVCASPRGWPRLAGLAAAVGRWPGVYGMPVPTTRRHRSLTARLSDCSRSAGWSSAAILLYRITLESGKFELLKDSIGHLTGDPRLQALLIAFAFGAFIEGAAGFGTPVAVAAAMLTGLGSRRSTPRRSACWRIPRRWRSAPSESRSRRWR